MMYSLSSLRFKVKCKIVFNDGTWIIGRRVNFWERLKIPETFGTHHWIVLEVSPTYIYPSVKKYNDLRDYIGKRIAIPIVSMKYLVFL